MIRIFSSSAQQIGKWGEDRAVQYLKGQGFLIIDRNVAYKYGELDVIAGRHGITHFFEVKTGREGSGVLPGENLHGLKIKKLRKSAALYCAERHIWNWRLQGILILQKQNGAYTVEVVDLN